MLNLAKRITKRIQFDMRVKRKLVIDSLLMINGIAPLKSISRSEFEDMYPSKRNCRGSFTGGEPL